ncbi:MAG TPA: biopolymer transporter ExbD [Gammaproteobacteria bacterium]|nr:biopolymer transporter ExbD [Gammaproteobacteria bacterium]
MYRRRSRRSRHHEPVEMNITAFMNLMVILVPFLLITAVFSRIAILELNLPSADAGQAEPDPRALQLEVIIRKDAIEVADRGKASRVIRNGDDGYDFAGLSAMMREIKSRHPDKMDITLLLEPEIAYDDLVQVMDTVRVAQVKRDGRMVRAELFPEISIGDAPRRPPVKQAMR